MRSSIRLRLIAWLVVPSLVVNFLGAGLTYWLAWKPAETAFDQSLADAAWALASQLRSTGGKIEIALSAQTEQVLRVDHLDSVYLAVRDQTGKTLTGDRDFPVLHNPERLDTPLAYDGVMHGEPVRVIVIKSHVVGTPVMIAAAETLRKRQHARARIITSLAMLGSLLTLLAVGLLLLAVRRGLVPLDQLRAQLNDRSYEDLAPLRSDVPQELRPMVDAINRLLERVRGGAAAQQHFLADMAHQLRTPLAGLKAQLEWLQQRESAVSAASAEADARQQANPDAGPVLQLMTGAVERMVRKSNQLLALAKAEPTQFEASRLVPVRLDQVVIESIQDFLAIADHRQIDLGFELAPLTILGDRFLLQDMIDNLIDNAIQYSPKGSRVTIRCHEDAQGKYFCVEDSGPGIPPAEREKIFNRLYRLDTQTAGSGLGLAIVRDIARDHGATITITERGGQAGALFTVCFPIF